MARSRPVFVSMKMIEVVMMRYCFEFFFETVDTF